MGGPTRLADGGRRAPIGVEKGARSRCVVVGGGACANNSAAAAAPRQQRDRDVLAQPGVLGPPVARGRALQCQPQRRRGCHFRALSKERVHLSSAKGPRTVQTPRAGARWRAAAARRGANKLGQQRACRPCPTLHPCRHLDAVARPAHALAGRELRSQPRLVGEPAAARKLDSLQQPEDAARRLPIPTLGRFMV